METLTAVGIITLAGLIQASFQLSVSVVTLLSGHALGRKSAMKNVLRLALSFLAGVVVMTMLIVSYLAYLLSAFYQDYPSELIWKITIIVLVMAGLITWVIYYRWRSGTSLWIPRGMSRHLTNRTKATRSLAESFSLGLTSVISEILFIIAPATATALALIHLPDQWKLPGVALYTVLGSLGTLTVVMLIGGGHNIGQIQKWRENNKRFLQFIAGSGFIVLALFIYANVVNISEIVSAGMTP